MDAGKELAHLVEVGREQVARGNVYYRHLDTPASAQLYLRIADRVHGECLAHFGRVPERLLDWGAGFGQLSWLLKNRGFEPTAYNVFKPAGGDDQPFLSQVSYVFSPEKVRLPFEGGHFDAVVSCGTLEHVEHPEESLDEIHRVLKDNGILIILMLPNRFSYTEALATLRGVSDHPVKYTPRSMRQILERHGFWLRKRWMACALPHNLTGMPGAIRELYGRCSAAVRAADEAVSRTPLLNRICGVVEGVAVKKG